MHDFVSFGGLEHLHRRLFVELSLDLVVDRVDVEAARARLQTADVADLRQVVHLLGADAEDVAALNLHEQPVAIESQTVDLGAEDKHQTQEQNQDCDQVLPPMTLSVATEQCAVLSQ